MDTTLMTNIAPSPTVTPSVSDAPFASDSSLAFVAIEANHMPAPEHSGDPVHDERAPLRVRIANFAAVVIPLAGLGTAIGLLWGVAFDWTHLAIMALMYFGTAIGITVGFHRLFTHKSFSAPKPVAAVLAALGSMAIEGPVIEWVATHRKHHQHSDQEGDPHSPHDHDHGTSVLGTLRGVWHAHVGWLLGPKAHGAVRAAHREGRRTSMSKYVKDLEQDPVCVWMSRTFPLWAAFGLVLPAALGGLLTMSWMGALLGFIWGGLVRVFLVHHVTWSINSVCHTWGAKPFNCHDESRNNVIFGVLAMGEGWHNNHHAFPASARHGLRWWEFDASYWIIRGLAAVGLARDIRVPNADRVAAKRAEKRKGH